MGSRWVFVPVAVLAAVLGGCTGPGSARPNVGGTATPAGKVTAAASQEVPPGKGGRLADDLNGDGYPELQVPVSLGPDFTAERTGFVFGSARGLRPEVHKVWSRTDLGLPPIGGDDGIGPLTTGDLDDDGFPEIMMAVPGTQAPRDPLVIQVAWGTTTGPVEKARPTRITVLPPGRGSLDVSIAAGDFDGDGRHDLAVLYTPAGGDPKLEVRYGPFRRDGSAARTDTRRGATGFLIADRIDPRRDRPTDLLLQHGNDGEQSANTLFTGGRNGLAKTGIELREGNGHAFGDFDGDGRRDIAIGDDGSRNNEPGNETEPPTVHGSVNVHYATGFASSRQIRAPGIRNGLAAADTNGDGRDELGLNLGPDSGTGAPGAGPTGGVPGIASPAPGGSASTGSGPTPGVSTPDAGVSSPGASGTVPEASGPAGTGSFPGSAGPGATVPGAGAPGPQAIGALAVTLGPNGPEGQVSLRHTMPATVGGASVPADNREARLLGAGDFDNDGRGEFALSWSPSPLFGRYLENPQRWWITDGSRDKTTFTTAGYRD